MKSHHIYKVCYPKLYSNNDRKVNIQNNGNIGGRGGKYNKMKINNSLSGIDNLDTSQLLRTFIKKME